MVTNAADSVGEVGDTYLYTQWLEQGAQNTNKQTNKQKDVGRTLYYPRCPKGLDKASIIAISCSYTAALEELVAIY